MMWSASAGKIFLSTPSARRATHTGGDFLNVRTISIHALREEGDQGIRGSCVNFIISIHALREEGDVLRRIKRRHILVISIHALREEGDFLIVGDVNIQFPISIHALREEGDASGAASPVGLVQFLSTPSARRATTMPTCPLSNFTNFYPRPPRGGRPTSFPEQGYGRLFLSTPSARRATRGESR